MLGREELTAETQGETERILGTWFKKTGHRDKIILASKVAGPAKFAGHIREHLGFNKEAIQDAVHKSLQRLQTDYIDLYQLHWPERNTNFFGKLGYKHDNSDPWKENFEAVLDALQEQVKAGNIRYVGLSNETPWGVMRYLNAAVPNRPKMITIQNPYSLLNRAFEVGLSEICHREAVGQLAYSPLAFGTLSGKYLGGKKPKNARLTLFPHYDRYNSPQALSAIESYAALAKETGFTLTQLALAFVNDRSFMTSNIIGATTLEQLEENIGTHAITLHDSVLEAIDAIHKKYANPAP